jgi:hypothetical protein
MLGLLGPENFSGFERAGLTCHAITGESTCAIVVLDLLVVVPKLNIRKIIHAMSTVEATH